MQKTLTIIGAGGHAKVVASTALANHFPVKGFLDDNPALQQQFILSLPVWGDLTQLVTVDSAVLGIGDNHLRKKIVEKYFTFSKWQTLIHPSAIVHPSAKIGKGCVIFAGAIIQPDVMIGDHCIINTASTIDHDCCIESYSHLAPGTHLAGGVKVGEGVFIGIGSVVIPYVSIGRWTQVAAGAVVVTNIAANQKVMGVPAKECSLTC